MSPNCPHCGENENVEYIGDQPTNTGPTAIDPGYVSVYECDECGEVWSPDVPAERGRR